jgi:flagellar biosynthesis GTPase FlhF
MSEAVRDIEAEMKSAVADGDYEKAGRIGIAAGFSLEFIPTIIANILIELGRPEQAKKFLPAIEASAEAKPTAETFDQMRRRREAQIAERQRREAEELERAKEWAAKAKLEREATEEAQAKAEREINQASSATLPEPRKPKPLVAANAVLKEMNERHAIIENVGGTSVIASWEPSKVNPKWMKLVYQGKDSFLLRYSNRRVLVDYPGGGSRLTGLGHWWLQHEDRTQHRGVIFAPAGQKVVESCLNLWQGWGVEARPGDWSKIKAHIRLVGGEHWEYLLHWIAWSIQHPAEQAEVALVLIGAKGVGKGTLAKVLQKVFGAHAFQVTSREEVIGKFNGHLEDCILFVADEAYWGGDKRCVGRLQGMITEERLPIERKGYDLIEAKNMLHIIMLAEPGWVIPAGQHERRYAAFDVSAAQRGNIDYFVPLNAEIDGVGPAAMLYDLQQMNLADFHPRQIPEGLLHGAALRKQQGLTLPPLEQWYVSVLHRGILPGALPNRANTTYTKSLMDDAKDHSSRLRYDLTDVMLRNFLTDPERVGATCFKYRSSIGNVWAFPPLAEARTAWESIWGEIGWDNPAEEWRRSNQMELA